MNNFWIPEWNKQKAINAFEFALMRRDYHYTNYKKYNWQSNLFFITIIGICFCTFVFITNSICLKITDYQKLFIIFCGISYSYVIALISTKFFRPNQLADRHKCLYDSYNNIIPLFEQDIKQDSLNEDCGLLEFKFNLLINEDN